MLDFHYQAMLYFPSHLATRSRDGRIDGAEMSQRLTVASREQIAAAVLRHRFTDEVETLVKDRSALADDVYNDVYRKADRDKILALPDGWLPESKSIIAKFGEVDRHYAEIGFDGGLYGKLLCLRKKVERRDDLSRRILWKHHGRCWKVYPSDHRLTARFVTLCDRQEDLQRRVREGEAQINSALANVSTVAALLKAWPEVEPFVKPLGAAPVKLPAISIKTLNETFRLPVAEAA
jgi:hypothetical protein